MNNLWMKTAALRIARLFLILLLIHSNFSLLVTAETTAQTLRQIQLSSEDNEIIAALELDGRPSQFTVYALANPDRVVVDLPAIKYSLEPDLSRLLNKPARQSGMRRITVQGTEEKVRVIFESSQKLAYTIERDASQIVLKFVKAPIETAQPVVNKIQPTPTPAPTPFTAPSPTPSPKPQLTSIGRYATTPAPLPKEKEQIQLSVRKGKKSFADGIKFEKRLQWELANQSFKEALSAEPDNPEYRLHLRRSAQNAAIQLSREGDLLIRQKDYPNAAQAFRKAYALDENNDEALNKFQQALLKVNTPKDAEQAVSGDTIRIVNQEERPLPVKDINQQIYFNNANLRQVIEMMANNMGLNVMFDETFRDEQKFQLKLKDISMARALDQVLIQTKHTFEQTDRRTIMIYQDTLQNRQRIEQLMFKTFYLSNTDPTEARTVVQAVIGQHRQVLPIKNLNAIVVRDTFRNLQMVQALLDSIDKNRSEVVVDVDIYEVSRSTSTEIGNQLATTGIGVTTPGTTGQPASTKTSAALSNLGGIGRAGIAAIAGTAGAPFLGGVGTIIGLPPSTLSLLKSKTNSKLLASTQIHALDGEKNQTKVGRKIPVRIGSVVPGIAVIGQNNNNNNGGFNGTIDNIQYQDVGLIIDVTPSVSNEGYVQIKMKLESSSVEPSSLEVNLTPTISQRSLDTIARVQDGKTAVVAGVKQESNGDSRTSIPVIGMVPILGRLFSTPRENSNLSDIIITVTPHIIRSPNLQPQDFKARMGGNFLTGVSLSIEDVLLTAQSEDDRERQMRGGSSLYASAQGTQPKFIQASAPNEEQRTNSNVNFSVVPNNVSQSVGESFFAAVSVSSQMQINEAQVSLKYDPALLELKSIQSGGLLGAQANIVPQGENGMLSFLIQQEKNNTASVEASGQLLLLEFTALRPGKSAISFVNQQQIMRQGAPLPVQIQTRDAGIEIKGK
jgi:general secretion pathway protein D